MIFTERFEDTRGIIRRRKSKDRQHNYQTKNDKRTNDDPQNNIQKTKDRTTQNSLKTWMNSRRVNSSCSSCDTRRFTVMTEVNCQMKVLLNQNTTAYPSRTSEFTSVFFLLGPCCSSF